MNCYIEEYLPKTVDALNEIKKSLIGNFGTGKGDPEKRVEAINKVIALKSLSIEAKELIEENEGSEPAELIEHDDVAIAKRYTLKAKKTRDRGISFELSFSDYKRLISKKTCYYTGVTLNHIENDPHLFTIDRKDPKVGYTKENSVSCANVVNSVKNQLLEQGNASLYLGKECFLKMAERIKDIDI